MNKRKRLSKEDRKIQICDVARTLFIEKGFENTTMKDIKEKTGISIGGLYYHYENIFEILKDVIMSAENVKNEMFFEIKDGHSNMTIEDLITLSCIEFLFDSSEYSSLYVHLLIAMKDNEALKALYDDRKKRAKKEFLDLLEKLDAKEYCFLSNDDFIDFFNITKIGNYYLKDEDILDGRKRMYIEFIKTYINRQKEYNCQL